MLGKRENAGDDCAPTRKKSKYGIPILQIDPETDFCIKRWGSTAEAAESLFGNRREGGRITIAKKTNGKAGGFRWETPQDVISAARLMLPGEEWKPLPFAEGWEISNMGRIKNPHRITLGTLLDKRGYMTAMIKEKSYLVSRLVLLIFRGEPPSPNCQADHINGNPHDNRLANLRWATPSENVSHSWQNKPQRKRKNYREQEIQEPLPDEEWKDIIHVDSVNDRTDWQASNKGRLRSCKAKGTATTLPDAGRDMDLAVCGNCKKTNVRRGISAATGKPMTWCVRCQAYRNRKYLAREKRWFYTRGHVHPCGYWMTSIGVHKNGKRQELCRQVARLVLTAFYGLPADGQYADHIDRNRNNNCLENLRWVSRQQNNEHAHGRKVLRVADGRRYPSIAAAAQENDLKPTTLCCWLSAEKDCGFKFVDARGKETPR